MGVIVYTDAEVEMGDRVSVTGVSSTDSSLDDPNRFVRAIWTRDVSDVQIVSRPEEPVYPFSDEFEGYELDHRWLFIGKGWAGIEGNINWQDTDWLGLHFYKTGLWRDVAQILQYAGGDWTMDTRMRMVTSPGHAFPDVVVMLKSCALQSPAEGQMLVRVSYTYVNGVWTSQARLAGETQPITLTSDTCFIRLRAESGKCTRA